MIELLSSIHQLKLPLLVDVVISNILGDAAPRLPKGHNPRSTEILCVEPKAKERENVLMFYLTPNGELPRKRLRYWLTPEQHSAEGAVIAYRECSDILFLASGVTELLDSHHDFPIGP